MKRPDLLILVAIWEFLTALIALIGIAAIAVFAFPQVCMMYGVSLAGGIFGLSVGILLLVCYIAVAVAGGIGLLSGKSWGRVLSIAQAALSLLSIPVGTIIGILILIYLTGAEVKQYFAASSQKPSA